MGMLQSIDRYDRLENRLGSQIPYVRGRLTLRADYLYSMYRSEGLDIGRIAKSQRLPQKTIQQAVGWCKENSGIVSRVWEEQARQAGLS